ncbi:MAG: hypothetical protein AAGA50_03525 [Pseudomonadota bacterium]
MEYSQFVAVAILYLYAGQVTWTNLALHAVLSGDDAQLWQQAKLGQLSAIFAKGVFLIIWPVLVVLTWIVAHFGDD